MGGHGTAGVVRHAGDDPVVALFVALGQNTHVIASSLRWHQGIGPTSSIGTYTEINTSRQIVKQFMAS